MIPVFEPSFGEEEIEAVVQALRRGEISGSFGESIPAFEREFADYVGVRHGVAVTSGTTALQLAVAAADLPAGSEILVSASTNVATALGAFHNGHVPVPVDSEPDSWNLDLDLLEGLIHDRTAAIIPVHLYGHPVDMDRLMAIADRHGLLVIEDAAEAHGATCRGRMVGSFGDMSCFSFYANKIITTGEGGMVVTDDDTLAERLRLLRNLGFTEPRFRHEVAGFNYRMTGYQAAFGRVQLGRIDEVVKAKRRLAQWYTERLASVEGIRTPREAGWARHVYWMYAILIESPFGASRDDVAARLTDAGIGTRTFFCPMNRQPFLDALPAPSRQDCPVADRLWQTGMYLPSSTTLTERQVDEVVAAIVAAGG